jgi:hypothetical protein
MTITNQDIELSSGDIESAINIEPGSNRKVGGGIIEGRAMPWIQLPRGGKAFRHSHNQANKTAALLGESQGAHSQNTFAVKWSPKRQPYFNLVRHQKQEPFKYYDRLTDSESDSGEIELRGRLMPDSIVYPGLDGSHVVDAHLLEGSPDVFTSECIIDCFASPDIDMQYRVMVSARGSGVSYKNESIVVGFFNINKGGKFKRVIVGRDYNSNIVDSLTFVKIWILAVRRNITAVNKKARFKVLIETTEHYWQPGGGGPAS